MNSALKLASLIRTMTGVDIAPEKYYLFEHRFADLMQAYSISNYTEMAAKIAEQRDTQFIDSVIERITTHETRFFRDESAFRMIAAEIIPERRHRLPLRIWSAACSTGQEVWSLAILIAEHFPELAESAQIFATDISAESLNRAATGLYSPFEISRGMPSHLLLKYFYPEGSGFRVRRGILPSVRFAKLNLIRDELPLGMDIVLCRNVAFYFSRTERAALFHRIRNAIAPGGALILGASEALEDHPENHLRHNMSGAVYFTFPEPAPEFAVSLLGKKRLSEQPSC